MRSRDHGRTIHKHNRCKHSKQLLEHVKRPMGEREKCQVRVERNFRSIPLIGRRVNTLARSNLLSSAYSIQEPGPSGPSVYTSDGEEELKSGLMLRSGREVPER